jgi:hypothetical protein
MEGLIESTYCYHPTSKPLSLYTFNLEISERSKLNAVGFGDAGDSRGVEARGNVNVNGVPLNNSHIFSSAQEMSTKGKSQEIDQQQSNNVDDVQESGSNETPQDQGLDSQTMESSNLGKLPEYISG